MFELDAGCRWKILAVTALGVFMASLDLFIVNIAFPDIAAEFPGASLSDLSWILNAYAIVFAALLVPAGRIADRVGRKRVYLLGLGVFAAASALCGVAPSVPALVGARILQATGGAMMIPATLGLILPAFAPSQRAVAIGIWSAAAGVAAALGPPIGGLLVQLSWRWIFVVNVPIAIAGALAAARILGEVREPEDHRPDLPGAAILALGIGLLTLGIVKGPDFGWGDPRTLAAFAGAALFLATFLRRSGRHPAPVIELPLLRIRSFALTDLAVAVFFAGFGVMLLSSVLLLTEIWGFSALEAGMAMTPAPVVAAIVAAPAGRLGGAIGQRPIATAGAFVFACGLAYSLAAVGPRPEYLTAYLPGALLAGAGFGLTLGTLPAVATSALPESRFATGTAVFAMARQLGSAIGVAVLVALIDSSPATELLSGLRRGWWFAVAAGIGTAAICLALPAARTVRRPALEAVG